MSTIPFRPDAAERIDELRDRFEGALKRGERPRIDDWLTSELDRAVALPELVALKLNHLVSAGDRTSAADYFARFPELRSDPTVALRLVQAELRAAQSVDPSVTEASFRERYPELARLPEWSGNQLLTTPQLGTTPFRPSGDTQTDRPPAGPSDPMVFLRGILAPPDRPGDLGRFGDFRIERILGAGGMGVVLAAHDAVLNRRVAIKLMRPEVAERSTAKERFLREARAMAAVEHPRIVIVHQVGERGGIPFLVMPLMAGQSLAKRLKAGPMSVDEAIRFGREAADGLAAAHAKGVIHRDVKPDNVWLEETAEGTHVRLLDFGLAREDGAEPLTHSGAIFGTPAYMAPEQASGEKVDGRADLFGLGCVLHEMATGTKAFSGPSMTAVLYALANHTPPPARSLNPRVPPALSTLIESLLAKKRDDRPGSAAAAAEALRAIEAGDPDATIPWRTAKSRIWKRTVATGGAAALALAVLVGIAALSGLFDKKDGRPMPGADDGGEPLAKTAVVPLTVRSIDVSQFRRFGPDDDRSIGILGKNAFAPVLNDTVQVRTKLSKPAYAYILAFRPDGAIDLCSPKDESTPPAMSPEPSYPEDKAENRGYGLAEGTGLWMFAVVASEKPLPAYKDWIAANKLDWKPRTAPEQTVWLYDGAGLETLQQGSSSTRSKDSIIASGAAGVVASTGRKLEAFGGASAVIGFSVGPKK